MTIKEKIINKIELTSTEVRDIINEEEAGLEIFDYEAGDELKYHAIQYVILKIEETFFMVYYYRGLGKYQDNDYEEQVALEVKPIQVVRTEWVEKE